MNDNMRIVGLISGGKDSLYNMLQCIAAGHEIVAIANIEPDSKGELDSYMFQSAGQEVISLISLCLGLPMFRHKTKGVAFCKDKVYDMTSKDEVEDLFELLSEVKNDKNVDGVSVGAIASDYQRTRIENVCSRLGLISFAYLWKRDQAELLDEMIKAQMEAIIIKVACIGLDPSTHLGMSIRQLQPHLLSLKEQFGVNVCGEGGEYETLTLNCPLYNRRINITESKTIVLSNDAFAPVGCLYVKKATLMTKSTEISDPFIHQVQNLNLIKSVTKNPYDYIQDCVEQNSENVFDVKSKVKSLPIPFPFESDEEVDTNENPKPESSKYFRGINYSKSQLQIKAKPNEPSIVSCSSSKCHVSCSSGWCFIGNVTGVNITDAFSCLQKNLEMNSYDFQDAVFVSLYVRDLSEFSKINKIYSQYMSHILPPARICIETNLLSDCNILVSLIAHKIVSKSQKLHTSEFSNRDALHVQSISHWAPASIGPYSQCIRIGRIYYLAGQIPLIPGTMEILKQPVLNQCRLTLRHVLRVLEAIDESLKFSNVLQAICYVTSESIATEVIDLWYDITKAISCTVTSLVVSGLPKSAPLEWEVMACKSVDPKVEEETVDLEDIILHMKRCVYKDLFASSLVCNFRFTKKKKNLRTFTPVGLNKALERCVQFLKADCKNASPLCALKLFYKISEPAVVSTVKSINYSLTESKTVFTVIPVNECESREVCLTVTGICH